MDNKGHPLLTIPTTLVKQLSINMCIWFSKGTGGRAQAQTYTEEDTKQCDGMYHIEYTHYKSLMQCNNRYWLWVSEEHAGDISNLVKDVTCVCLDLNHGTYTRGLRPFQLPYISTMHITISQCGESAIVHSLETRRHRISPAIWIGT